MIQQTIRHAVEHQERLRREAAAHRRIRRPRGRSRGILASVATLLRTIFAQQVPLGTVLPATH